MSKSPTRDSQDVLVLLKAAEGEALAFGSLFDALSSSVSHEHCVLVTSLPRGSLQIVQPPKVKDVLLKAYSKEYHRHDRPGWEAMIRDSVVDGPDCWPRGQFENSPYFIGLLQRHGLAHVIAAPLAAPVMDGYAGAIELYRTEEQGAFTAAEQRAVAEFARELDAACVRSRESRRGPSKSAALQLSHRIDLRQFIFGSNLKLRYGQDAFNALDPSLRNNMLDLARQRFAQVNGEQLLTDRVSLPDGRGDLWNFRVVTHSSYPAMGDGPFVFFCIQPDCEDWGLLHSSDFAADPEIARLVPAMKFMQEQFHRGPTLHEIARTVHLSPFHFHRRFTELMGITPKHFLLDCQIEAAKSQLVARQKELVEIASACGFAHQSHFTSRFKQATGLTPTRWRRLAIDASR